MESSYSHTYIYQDDGWRSWSLLTPHIYKRLWWQHQKITQAKHVCISTNSVRHSHSFNSSLINYLIQALTPLPFYLNISITYYIIISLIFFVFIIFIINVTFLVFFRIAFHVFWHAWNYVIIYLWIRLHNTKIEGFRLSEGNIYNFHL